MRKSYLSRVDGALVWIAVIYLLRLALSSIGISWCMLMVAYCVIMVGVSCWFGVIEIVIGFCVCFMFSWFVVLVIVVIVFLVVLGERVKLNYLLVKCMVCS